MRSMRTAKCEQGPIHNQCLSMKPQIPTQGDVDTNSHLEGSWTQELSTSQRELGSLSTLNL